MNRLATALLVLAVVAGPPLLAGIWLQHRWQTPTRAQIAAWAEQPLTAGTIIAGCVAVAGLAWLLLLTHLTRQALTGWRRRMRRLRRLPVPTPAQMTASSMAGVAAFTLPTATIDHPQPPVASDTPQLPDPARPDVHNDRPPPAQPGVALPGGGWIPYRTAAAITALAAALWFQRRRHYRPDPGQPRDHHDDADLQPLPPTVGTVAAALADNTTGADRTPPPQLSKRLPEGVLLLTGPGAAASARGLIVEAALSDSSTVSMHPDDRGALLPLSGPAVAELPAGTGEHVMARTVVVFSEGPVSVTHRWHVASDGTATGSDLTEPRRLCTLNPQTTADLLTFIRRSQQIPPSVSPPSPIAPSRPPAAGPEPAPATDARLMLLGSCHLTVAGEPVRLRRTAGLQVLAYLAIHPDGATRSELTRAIWPHLPPATISQRLHTTLADLRQQLRPLLSDDPIIRRDDRYRLNSRRISSDLHPWRTAVNAMTHAVSTTDRDQACRTVIDLHRGNLAAEHTWHWLTPIREQTRRTVIDAYATLAEHAHPDQALPLLQRAITIDPYNEALRQQAAGLLRATGDHASAIELIERLHQRIAAEEHLRR
ncbi:BTAD domain-containing putative transcriptional regulator [Actinoplanes sp. NPDC049599]|uniref:AfsR/SARP family transcriptional regulator n=1 Tax=Actinoplanes sp. NPDC049599 TaxID=3363903 RepID=UPI0037ADC590